MAITGLLCALAIYDQVTSPPIEHDLLGALLVALCGWAGWGADSLRSWFQQ